MGKRTTRHRSDNWKRNRRRAAHKASHARRKARPTMRNITTEQLVDRTMPLLGRIASGLGHPNHTIDAHDVTTGVDMALRTERRSAKRIASACVRYGDAVTVKPNGNMVIDVRMACQRKGSLDERVRMEEALRQDEEDVNALCELLERMEREDGERQALHDLATDSAVGSWLSSNSNRHSGGGACKRGRDNASGVNNWFGNDRRQRRTQHDDVDLDFGLDDMRQGRPMSGSRDRQVGGWQDGGCVGWRGTSQGAYGAMGSKLANRLKGASKEPGKATATSKRVKVLRQRMDMLRKRIVSARRSRDVRLVKALEGQMADIQGQMLSMTKATNKGKSQASRGTNGTAER